MPLHHGVVRGFEEINGPFSLAWGLLRQLLALEYCPNNANRTRTRTLADQRERFYLDLHMI